MTLGALRLGVGQTEASNVAVHRSNSRLSSRRRVSCGRRARAAQLRETSLGPQGRAESEALIEGDGLQAILDHRAHPDQADTVRDERAQIGQVGIGDPRARETVMLQEVE